MTTGFSPKPMDRDAAETVALSALSFLVARPTDLDRFMALTGLGSDTIRQGAGEPGFLGGVLDHLLTDERLLIEFAAEAQLPPEDIARARHRLERTD